MSWSLAVVSLGGVILGYVGTLATEERRDARATRQDVRARALEAENNRRLWETAFQRESLFGLQDALLQLGRAESAAHLERWQQGQNPSSGRQNSDPQKDAALFEAKREVKRFAVRIRDPDIRDLAKRCVQQAEVVRDGVDRDAMVAARQEFGETVDETNDLVGVLLRRGDLSDLPDR